ncbi:alpha/beta hydrolase [Aestuariivirga litoralis]|uniref:alpha/beta hydrolase n=1 Tax=Aestuariivirga litoralis TaxID=2650924 RepID=UPI0018C8213E|nr:alpha/beta hydrolase [Aestuariivirga litoralis]MBG1232839.1 alpha/beta hydrolase [Aestuariivirga litoralis]
MSKYSQLKDPGIVAFLEEGERLYPENAVSFSMAEQREFYNKYCAHFSGRWPKDVATRDFTVGAVPCRRYMPRAPRGQLLYLHGGGYVVGGLESHNSICADLADQAQVDVIAVEYRLAPEHKFPAAFDDCWAVFESIVGSGGPCVIAGDSAGGNLAAGIAIKARDLGIQKIKGQVLIYPGLGGDVTKGSYITQANAPGLTTKDVLYYHDTYGSDGSKLAEPLRETDFSGLPRAFLVACAHDPLHDDAVHYAAKLQAAGVAAELREEPDLVHAYLRARFMSRPAAESFRAIVAAIRAFAA